MGGSKYGGAGIKGVTTFLVASQSRKEGGAPWDLSYKVALTEEGGYLGGERRGSVRFMPPLKKTGK